MYFESIRDQQVFYCRGENFCPAHLHASVELLYVLSGEKTVWLDGEKYQLHASDFLVCPPYSVHRFCPSENSEQIVASVPEEYCKRFHRFSLNNVPESPVCKDTDRTLLPYLKILGEAENELVFEGAAELLLGRYMKRAAYRAADGKSGLSKIREIAEYIDAHFAEPLTLKALAGKFGYAPNYFSTLFNRYFQTALPNISTACG